uniref:Uncharacterized protein n=1 Tax=viral metagenome TaxID=1070528 RepID=A0A6C0C905_9ZZZZ
MNIEFLIDYDAVSIGRVTRQSINRSVSIKVISSSASYKLEIDDNMLAKVIRLANI